MFTTHWAYAVCICIGYSTVEVNSLIVTSTEKKSAAVEL